MIEIEHTETFLIDEKELIEDVNLTKNSTNKEIENGVADYVLGCDDVDYYQLKQHIKEIAKKIENFLKNT